jgi:hypothetical protein
MTEISLRRRGAHPGVMQSHYGIAEAYPVVRGAQRGVVNRVVNA